MSTYYSDPKVARAEAEESLADLRDQIENIRITFPKAGYRMLHHYLDRNRVKISEYKLRKVMLQFKLFLKKKRRYVRTTNSEHGFDVYPNLIKDLKITRLNQVWVSDITYIRITNGFVYLAVVIDLYSRKVIGWEISKKIDGELVLGATSMAFQKRGCPRGVIHHSDRGVQYLCDKHIKFLNENKFKISCAAKGNPYENAFAESFMKTLKSNQVDLFKYETIVDVIENVPEFIEEVYNKKRLHSSLNYLTPEEFEVRCTKKSRTGRHKKKV
jgi:putative transposase